MIQRNPRFGFGLRIEREGLQLDRAGSGRGRLDRDAVVADEADRLEEDLAPAGRGILRREAEGELVGDELRHRRGAHLREVGFGAEFGALPLLVEIERPPDFVFPRAAPPHVAHGDVGELHAEERSVGGEGQRDLAPGHLLRRQGQLARRAQDEALSLAEQQSSVRVPVSDEQGQLGRAGARAEALHLRPEVLAIVHIDGDHLDGFVREGKGIPHHQRFDSGENLPPLRLVVVGRSRGEGLVMGAGEGHGETASVRVRHHPLPFDEPAHDALVEEAAGRQLPPRVFLKNQLPFARIRAAEGVAHAGPLGIVIGSADAAVVMPGEEEFRVEPPDEAGVGVFRRRGGGLRGSRGLAAGTGEFHGKLAPIRVPHLAAPDDDAVHDRLPQIAARGEGAVAVFIQIELALRRIVPLQGVARARSRGMGIGARDAAVVMPVEGKDRFEPPHFAGIVRGGGRSKAGSKQREDEEEQEALHARSIVHPSPAGKAARNAPVIFSRRRMRGRIPRLSLFRPRTLRHVPHLAALLFRCQATTGCCPNRPNWGKRCVFRGQGPIGFSRIQHMVFQWGRFGTSPV